MAANLQIRISAHDAASSVLSGITGAVGGLVKGLGAIGLAAQGVGAIGESVGGLVAGLVSGNSEMEQVRAKFMAFTKDGTKTDQLLADLKQEAAATPFEFNEMAAAMAGLMPASKMAGRGVMDLVKQAEILAASNPEQGLEGAAFALREAVSGDFTSVIERFNLPRSYINQLKEEGVPALEIVSRAMQEMGYDASLVSGMAGTMQGRWSTLMDTFTGIKDRITAPLFEALKVGLGEFQGWLDSNKPLIDEWAGKLAGGIQWGIDQIGILLGKLGEIGSYLGEGNQRDLMREWFGDAGPVIDEVVRNIKLIPGALGNLKDNMVRAFQTGGWEGVATFVRDGLAAEWGKIDWAAIWDTVQNVGESVTTWLGEQWAKIDWRAIWQSIDDLAGRAADWLATVDWERVGADIGRYLGDAFTWALDAVGSLLTGGGGGGGGGESGIWKLIKTLAESIGKLALGLGKALIDGMVKGLVGLGDALMAAIRTELAKVKVDLGPFHVAASGVTVDLPGGASAQLAAGLPGFATGGVVGGPLGAPQLAVVHGGERVLTPQQQMIDYGQMAAAMRSAMSGMAFEANIGGQRTSVVLTARSYGLAVS